MQKQTLPQKRGLYIGRMMQSYRRSARLRGQAWQLTRDEFASIVTSACHYCGARGRTRIYHVWCGRKRKSQRMRSRERVNGIDRVANGKGYTRANSVACCARCNSMKSSLSLREFLAHIARIMMRAA